MKNLPKPLGLALVALLVGAWAAALPMRWPQAPEDALLRFASRPAAFDNVLVMDIDDASLAALRPRLGPWPFKRDVHALLIGYLRDSGAKAVVLDIVFDEAREGDAALAATMGRRHDLALAAAGASGTSRRDQPPKSVWSLDAEAAAGVGSIRWAEITLPAAALLAPLDYPGALGVITAPLDEDLRLRRHPLLHSATGRLYPSLVLAAQILTHADARLATEPSAILLGAHRWPLDDQGRAQVILPSNAAQVPTLSYLDAIRAALGEVPDDTIAGRVNGRVVFIGSNAFLGDAVATPQGSLPGVAVLANAFTALERDDVIRPAPAAWKWALLLFGVMPFAATAIAARRWVSGGSLLRSPIVCFAAAGIAAFVALAAATSAAMIGWRLRLEPWPALLTLVTATALFAFSRWRSLVDANRRLDEERRVADAANAAKSEFLAIVSHELRTPLNAVIGLADVLLTTPLSAQQRSYVSVFRNSGSTLALLIDDLLDLSKIEANRLELHDEDFELRPALEQSIDSMRFRAQAKGITLALEVAADVPAAVRGDPRRLAQVIVNLVGNAIKFTQQGGVEVSVRRLADARLRFAVQDSGIGIAASKLALIFSPFVQADSGVSRAYGGTGLGLSISQRLVALMGGRIEVQSEPGIGSTFAFALPLAEAATAPLASERPDAIATPSIDGPQSQALFVLLVEDNEVNVIVMQAMLQPVVESMDVAGSGEVAIEMFRKNRYDLVLMDVQMPGIDGLEATRRMRAIESEQRLMRTPIVALTAHAFAEDRRASLDAGCDAHLTKPIAQQRLLDAVAALCSPRHSAAQTARRAAEGSADSAFDRFGALDSMQGDDVRYQRAVAHARVFLADWPAAFAATLPAEQRQALARDLQTVAGRVGAKRLAQAAAALVTAMPQGDSNAIAETNAAVLSEIHRALASLSVSAQPRQPR